MLPVASHLVHVLCVNWLQTPMSSTNVWVIAGIGFTVRLIFNHVWVCIIAWLHTKKLRLLKFLCLLFLVNIFFRIFCVHFDFIRVFSYRLAIKSNTVLASCSLERHSIIRVPILRWRELNRLIIGVLILLYCVFVSKRNPNSLEF
jgi:hypothetical protein